MVSNNKLVCIVAFQKLKHLQKQQKKLQTADMDMAGGTLNSSFVVSLLTLSDVSWVVAFSSKSSKINDYIISKKVAQFRFFLNCNKFYGSQIYDVIQPKKIPKIKRNLV